METSSSRAMSVCVESIAVESLAAIEPENERLPPARAQSPAGAVHTFSRVVALSRAMAEVFGVLRRLAPSDVTLTFIGETGTGKNVMARAVHDAGPRARGPFVVF